MYYFSVFCNFCNLLWLWGGVGVVNNCRFFFFLLIIGFPSSAASISFFNLLVLARSSKGSFSVTVKSAIFLFACTSVSIFRTFFSVMYAYKKLKHAGISWKGCSGRKNYRQFSSRLISPQYNFPHWSKKECRAWVWQTLWLALVDRHDLFDQLDERNLEALEWSSLWRGPLF